VETSLLYLVLHIASPLFFKVAQHLGKNSLKMHLLGIFTLIVVLHKSFV
jgi:hypothetical protein